MTVKIDLPADVLDFIDRKVADGQYVSTNDVIVDAVRLLAASYGTDYAVEDLRRAWDEGIASGEPTDFDLAELKLEARAYHATRTRR